MNHPAKLLENRLSQRYKTTDLLLCISSVNIGKVIDISSNGLGLRYIGKNNIPKEWVGTLVLASKDKTITNLPLKLVWEGEEEHSNICSNTTKLAGVQFPYLSVQKKLEVNNFIEKYLN